MKMRIMLSWIAVSIAALPVFAAPYCGVEALPDLRSQMELAKSEFTALRRDGHAVCQPNASARNHDRPRLQAD